MNLTLFKKALPLLAACFLFLPGLASAHQPRIVQSRQTAVDLPEISKAYYGTLTGQPDVFTITSAAPFNLYVNILAPDIAEQKKDVSVSIVKDDQLYAALDGSTFAWKKFFEPFGHDTYWMGPEFREKEAAGTYVITVTSPNNKSKYALAIGEAENFNAKEILNALTLVPQIKTGFFHESPANFIFSPYGWGTILALYALAAIVGLLYRFVLKKMAERSVRRLSKNIGTPDRLLRLAIGVVLLIIAITTSWSLILIFASGFTVFEAAFSWCGLYAALGKNTCPILV